MNYVDPNDVFPRRNLPTDAENWGRVMEDRIVALEAQVRVLMQQVQALNRTLASR